MNGHPTRDMTVGELMRLLADFPDYYPVVPYINGTIGVLTALRAIHFEDKPVVLVGEADLMPDLIESMIHRERTS